VEDSATVRADIVQALSSEFQCVEAQDGVAGMDAALKFVPDAMIVDIEMPLMNGIELLESIKKDSRTHLIPVVMITTTAGSKYINDCRKRGCAGFLLKPVDKDYLSAKLKQLLRTAPA
jgi:CheY-like chemotaxis protein